MPANLDDVIADVVYGYKCGFEEALNMEVEDLLKWHAKLKRYYE